MHVFQVLGLLLLMLLFITPIGQRTQAADEEDAYTRLRERMVVRQIQGRGIQGPHVLNAMKVVPGAFLFPFNTDNMPTRIIRFPSAKARLSSAL